MTSFRDALAGAVKKGLCQVLSLNEQAAALVNRLTPGDFLEDLRVPAALTRLACDRDMPTTPPPPPFQGGQCCDDAHQIFYTFSLRDKDSGSTRGPFNSNVITRTGKLVSVKPSGDPAILFVTTVSCAGVSVTDNFGGFGFPNEEVTGFAVTNVNSFGGANPGTCGDPPSVLPDLAPNWNITNNPITYVNNEGTEITIPVVAAFGYADIDINAELNIPVTIDVGGLEFNADFNLNTGDISFFPVTNNFGDRRPGNKPIDYSPLPGDDIPPPPQGSRPQPPPIDEVGEEKERLIVGCVVTVTAIEQSKVSTFFQTDNPNISIPNLGHVQFLCRVGKLSAAWTSDIPVKNRRNIIPCPWEGGAFRVAGTPQSGVSWVITPLYSLKENIPVFPEG